MTPAEVTAWYRNALVHQRAGMLALARELAGRHYSPARPMESLRWLGALSGTATVRAQIQAVGYARVYLARFYTASGKSGGGPFPVPDRVLGLDALGRPLLSLTGLAPAIAARAGPDVALRWLERIAVSEPIRAANATVTHAAMTDARLHRRIDRVTSPGACAFCRLIADRGYTEAAAGFAAHANCSCTAAPSVRMSA